MWTNSVKVFQLNDCDCWCGYDLESVKAAYMKETSVDEVDAFDNPREIGDEELATRTMFWGDDDQAAGIKITFK